jgi:hypothetical protein
LTPTQRADLAPPTDSVSTDGSGRTEPRTRLRAAAVVTLILLAVGGVGALLQYASGSLGSAGVLPEPQKYYALSFTDPVDLPRGLTSSLDFTFEIDNHTGGAADPGWQVLALSGSGSPVDVASGRSFMPAGGKDIVPVTVTPPAGTTVIQVSLPGQPLAPIQFHLTPEAS